MPPHSAKPLTVSGGSLGEGCLIFRRFNDDSSILSEEHEKNLRIYRKMDILTRGKCMLDLEWLLKNIRTDSKGTFIKKSSKKTRNIARLKKAARSIKK